jgi:hemolysin D
VVKPGDTLLSVVPLSATPEIEAMVLNKDAGFVLAGQKATVKLEGTISGEVVDVSRDSNKGEKLGLVYPVRGRLDAAFIDVDGKRVAVAPGMAVSIEIVTGNRRVIDFLLSPILRYQGEAGRER